MCRRRTSVAKASGRDKWASSDMWITAPDRACTAAVFRKSSKFKCDARNSNLLSSKQPRISPSAPDSSSGAPPALRKGVSSVTEGSEVNLA